MGKYSIKELERLSGIKAHTLRIWEKRYNLFEPDRTATNIRYYSDQDLKKLLNISILCHSGVKISKIVSMEFDELKSNIEQIEDVALIKQKRVDSFIIASIDYDEEEFNKLYNTYVKEIGIRETFTDVIYPFLEKVGILWLTDEIEPAQEHFISHLIRQKLIAAIDDLPAVSNNAKTAILFLPEGEYHELGLLFFSFLYKQKGVRVYYLGQSTPVEQIKQTAKLLKPNWILTYSVVQPKRSLKEVLGHLAECQADDIYFIENNLQKELGLSYPKQITAVQDYNQLF